MNVYEEPREGGGAPKADRPDPMKEFKAMPSAERWLAVFAATVIVAYVIRGLTRYWGDRVFDVLSLLGAAAVLGLVVPQLLGVRLLTPRVRMFIFAIGGILPAAGFVFDLLAADFWYAAMLAAGIAMGLTAWQIAERERLLK
ncbi:MAG: hypothetical protein L6Q95_12510 [Planctomycetes bacterium]|nr:hypothetical protein [Planctomycetota bacterium]